MRQGDPFVRLVAAVALCALAGVRGASGEAQSASPTFEAQAAAITLDVVVTDEDGQPLRGLSQDDFAVFEDGRRQRIVGFEARHAGLPAAEGVLAGGPLPLTVTNQPTEQAPERAFALLIDDLGISAPLAEQVKAALAGWIGAEARPADEITILTTSGDVWWSDRIARGRDDLLLVLGRVRGKALPRSGMDPMSDWEAFRIAVHEQSTEAMADPADRSRPPDAAGASRPGMQGTMHAVSRQLAPTVLARVTQRWLDTRVCSPCVDPDEMAMDCREIRLCSQRVQSRAQELHSAWRGRGEAVYAGVARLSRALAGAPGRKAILLVSEELFDDTSLRREARAAVDASQRANTAVYFLGARGLAGSSPFSAAAEAAPRAADIGVMGVEQVFLATAAGVALAEDTGGVAITSSNDLGAGLARMAADSTSYYLLGYQPESMPDGRWHSLQVKLARPGVTVRARRGYLAARAAPSAGRAGLERAREPSKGPAGTRVLAPELLAGSLRGGLPLRLATYVHEPRDGGGARVQIVVEIDNGSVRVERASRPWKASLDLTILAASLGRPLLVPIDERLELSLDPTQVGGGWWLVPREVWLPPGIAQIRVAVRDVGSGATGLVSDRVLVPDAEQAYVSTPVVTDRTLAPLRSGDPPRLVPTALRSFGRRAQLFCQYEVFLFGAWNLPGVARLEASHSLRRLDGTILAESESTPIAIDSGRAVRRIALPLEGLEAGSYELSVSVEDRLSGRSLAARSSFVIAPDTVAAGDR